MTSSRGLSARELRELIAEYGSLEAARHARPEIADFIKIGEQLARTFQQFNESIKSAVPLHAVREPELVDLYEREVSEIALLADIRDELAARRPDAAPTRQGRPAGSYVERKTFEVVLKMIVDGHASAREIEQATRTNDGLEFVNRKKAGRIIRQIDGHRRAAKTALVAQKLPSGFRATPFGVLLPKV